MLDQIKQLYFVEGLSQRQVARQLGVSPGYVQKRLKSLGGGRPAKLAVQSRATPEYREKISRTQIGENNHQVKLTEQQVLAIRKEYDLALLNGHQKSATQYYLAKKYGVKRPTISDIVLRRTWKHI